MLAQFVGLVDMLGFYREDGATFRRAAPHSENGAQEVIGGCIILHDFFLSKTLPQIFVVSDRIEGQNDSLVKPVIESNFSLCRHIFLINYSIFQRVQSLFHQPPFIISGRLFLHLAVENCSDPVS